MGFFDKIKQVCTERHFGKYVVVNFCFAIVSLGHTTAHESVDVTFDGCI